MSPLALELVSLTATLVVEVAVAAAASPRESRRAIVVAVVCVNLVTHPLAGVLLPMSQLFWHFRAWLLAEALVIGFEGLTVRLVTGAPARLVWRIVVLGNVLGALLGAVASLGRGSFASG